MENDNKLKELIRQIYLAHRDEADPNAKLNLTGRFNKIRNKLK